MLPPASSASRRSYDAPHASLGRRLHVLVLTACVVLASPWLAQSASAQNIPQSAPQSAPQSEPQTAPQDAPTDTPTDTPQTHVPGTAAGRSSDTTFGTVRVGAGGYVTGLSISDDGSTRVVRTDGFGGYRWDGSEWKLNTTADSMPAADVRLGMGGGILASTVAPSNPDRVYMAFADGVFRSDDASRTWTRVLSNVRTAANDDFRTLGSRIMVDPRNADVVYYGTQLSGLMRSEDAGETWIQVPTEQLPLGERGDITDKTTRGSLDRPTGSENGKQFASGGITPIAIDRAGPQSGGRSQVLYAASYGHGVYRSADAGRTWTKSSPDSIKAVKYMRVLSNRDVIATVAKDPVRIGSSSEIWRMRNGVWTEVTPKQATWHSIAEDPNNPGFVAVIAMGGALWLSNDYGVTWRNLKRSQSSTNDVPWLAWALNYGANFMSTGEIVFDPVVPGRLWFTEGTGVWLTDLTPSSHTNVAWRSQSRGIEQLVPTDVISPPGGKPVMSAWDRPIFRAEDPESYPTQYGPVNNFGSAWSLDYSVTDPSYVVASVASHHWPHDPSPSGYSTDGGRTWTRFWSIPEGSTNSMQNFGFGSIAVGAPGNLVWAPAYGKRPQYTLDGGRTWRPITLPGVTDYSPVNNRAYYVNRRVLVADKAVAGTFYLYLFRQGVFRTTDGARTWTKVSDHSGFTGADWTWAASMKAVPGRKGELYMTPGRMGGPQTFPFLHSTDGGATWTRVPRVTAVTAFGFGKAYPGSSDPTIFIAGYVSGEYGLYRSTNGGESWTWLATYPDGKTPYVSAIDGDKDVAGRFFLSMTGNGWTWGSTTGRPVSYGSAGPGDEPPAPDPSTNPRPALSARIAAPRTVAAGRPFRVAATATRPAVRYTWRAVGCRIARPTARVTTVRCTKPRGPAPRVLRVTVTTPAKATVTKVVQIRVRR